MDLIIGGAYQGKLDYAKKTFGISGDEICVCTEEQEPDFSKRCLVHYEKYVLYCMRNGKKPVTDPGDGKVVLADDIFCGVVPIDGEIRAWREECGRTLTALALGAKTVTRLFCGLPMKMKEEN